MLLTLKQKDQDILSNARAIFTVKSGRNNGGSGPNTRLCARDEREEEGEDGASFLYCAVITVGSCLEPTVIVELTLDANNLTGTTEEWTRKLTKL